MNLSQFVYPFNSWWIFGLFLVLAIIIETAINILHINRLSYISLSINIYIFFILGKYLMVELLDHRVDLCLTSWETSRKFSKVVVPFYTHTIKKWEIQSLHKFANIYIFLILAILLGVKWCFIMILTCVFLKINDVNTFSCAFWPFCVFVKWMLKSFDHF